MSESEWDTIYRNLSLKETDELIGYLQKHAEDEWMPMAFEVMEKIIIERLGELPAKDEIAEDIDLPRTDETKQNSFVELKKLIIDNDPVFYDPQKVTTLVKWIYRSVNILIVLYLIQYFIDNYWLFQALFDPKYKFSSMVFSLVSSVVGILLVIIMLFFEYKFLAYILKTLRQMEINSRKK